MKTIRFATMVAILLLAAACGEPERPIGVFDSGTGGLTVLQALVTLDEFDNDTGQPGADGVPDFAGEEFQYLADQANMPYGNYAAVNRTDLLKEHILRAMGFLLGTSYELAADTAWTRRDKTPVKMVVIGCNTATAYALEDIAAFARGQDPGIPVVGVINAGVKAAMAYQETSPGTIGVFATAGTVASNGYPTAIRRFAQEHGRPEPPVVSQGGVGLAESIDRDWSYISDTATVVRAAYKGPSLTSPELPIDTALLRAYNFNASAFKLLCESDPAGGCAELQLNDPGNYVRYHLVTLLEKMKRERYPSPLNTLLLACTHYPYVQDTIAAVLKELYDHQEDGAYRYREVLAPAVELIDPAVETAREAYQELRAANRQRAARGRVTHRFFISVPNTALDEIQLQPDGWFTYDYKYGRTAGEPKQYVRYVPFDRKNVPAETYERFRTMIPEVSELLEAAVK